MSLSTETWDSTRDNGKTSNSQPSVVPVIQYHMIDLPSPSSRVRGGFTPQQRFAKQMGHLIARGYKFLTASELIEHYLQNGRFPPRGITVTFDDGCRDNFTNAFPVLRELGIKATMFIVPSAMGQISGITLPEGEPPRPHLSRDEILEMSKIGIEFGSHTMNHRLLNEIPMADVKYEVESSKRVLEDLLQTACKTFAYPAGYYNAEVARVVESAGHICAFSTVYGPTDRIDLFAMNRMEILRRDRFICHFARKLNKLPR